MIPRVLISAAGSGAGKTAVAAGLLGALRRRERDPVGFKVGPDFIDPSYHALATGRPARNLDAFMSGAEAIAPLFRHGTRGAKIAVVEGAMGLFDGANGRGELASAAQVAKLLRTPVILVLDASSVGRSIAATLSGFVGFDPEVRIGGVVLNRVGSDNHESILREAVEQLDVPVLGVLRRDSTLSSPERHLGLVPVGERLQRASDTLERLASVVEQSCDLPAIEALAESAPQLPGPTWSAQSPGGAESAARVAVARGPAFSFHYSENLELLQGSGAELLDFDPLQQESLPPGTEGLILAGGFPEVFVEELTANRPLREEIAELARRGAPILAECGGLLYLAEEFDGHPMCGVIAAQARMSERVTLGYREALATGHHPLWPAGSRVRAHEFHYSKLEPAAGQVPAWILERSGQSTPEGHVTENVHASYLHTHWASTPQVAERFVAAAQATSPTGTL